MGLLLNNENIKKLTYFLNCSLNTFSNTNEVSLKYILVSLYIY